ncbi:MAG: saccharopine dehydrogenase family protein, partial [Nocardioidaceae bacterium]
MPEQGTREFDLVLFGATGFTGRLVAEYLARNAPGGCRGALAGRNRARLEAVREHLATLDDRAHPELGRLPLLIADATDRGSLAEIARRARVVISTVGPYQQYGEPLVAACAEAGTDYVDITGEPEFVDEMYLKHHRRAVETGARLVHACGFDSIPHDLGALFTVRQLPHGVPITLRGMVGASGTISGATFHSAINALSRVPQSKAAATRRRATEPRPEGRRVRSLATRPHFDKEVGRWLVPLPTIDPLIVKRSAAALDEYGPDFAYAHYAAVKRLPTVVGGLGAVGAIAAGVRLPPVRRFLLGRVPVGEGPSAARRAKSRFTVRFVGEGGGRRVCTEVTGGDPGYDETAKMLSEAAFSLAFDDNPATAGQVTTAQAMGDNLIDRLRKAGIGFEVT